MLKKHKKPTISVFMPVYNAQDFLAASISSIKAQTEKNWELLIVDDYSTDNSFKIAKKFAREDKRIRVYRNGKHRGVAGAANLALPLLKGQFIARMDADDVSLPQRFEQQLKYLQNHPKVIAVGGQCYLINKDGQITGKKRFPTDAQKTKETMFYRIPVQQPAMMINKTLLPKNFTWYEDGLNTAEEVELLFKLFQYGEVKNLKNYVLEYRIHGKNISLQKPKETFYLTLKTRLNSILKYGYRPTLKGVVVTAAQTLIVSILPSEWIYPVYSFVYSSKKIIASFQLPEFTPSFSLE